MISLKTPYPMFKGSFKLKLLTLLNLTKITKEKF